MRVVIMAVIGLIAFVQASSAAEKYPDMLGTWTGTADRVIADANGRIEFRTDQITVEITEQRDRRFVGRLVLEGNDVQIIGVFLDRTTFRWAQPAGFADGRLLHPNTFETCFLRLSEFSKIAACETLNRKK